jgi:hypothetical protein
MYLHSDRIISTLVRFQLSEIFRNNVSSKGKHMAIRIIAEAILYFFLCTKYMVSCAIFVIFMGEDYKSEQKHNKYKEHINPATYEIYTCVTIYFLY